MISLVNQNGRPAYNLLHLTCSSTSDIANLLKKYPQAAAGSICFCDEDSCRYRLNTDKTEWKKMTSSNVSGGGGSSGGSDIDDDMIASDAEVNEMLGEIFS